MDGPENSIFRKLKSVDRKKMPLTTKIILHFYFPFKVFPENFTERERERVRVREEKKHSNQSDDRWRTPSSSPRRSRSRWQTFQSPLIAISSSRDRAVDRDLAFARSHRIEIAIDGTISRSLDREIRERKIRDRDRRFARSRRRSRS